VAVLALRVYHRRSCLDEDLDDRGAFGRAERSLPKPGVVGRSIDADPSLNHDAFDDGWYRIGDLGCLDDEGFLTIVDRKKDIIIRAGMNISAAEVEAVLISMPQIADIAVVAAPDRRTGEHACAFVRPAPRMDTPTVDQVREHMARAGIAKYKWPEEIRSYPTDFPRTAAGKVRKAELRAMLS
jgi:acyl-CoA synthetase